MPEICKSCGQFVKLKVKRKLDNPDTKKLVKIMEDNNLSFQDVQDVLGISKRTLMRWLALGKEQKIKSIFFEVLELKGYV